MARGGIYKGEVLRARDKLRAMGRYPSIDAVRLELGNTGSKATIHRYLKEIEEEEGGKTGSKVAISESLHDLVARLSERLHLEAETRITELVAKHADEMAKVRQELMAAQSEAAEIRNALGGAVEELAQERTSHQRTQQRLQEEVIAHATINQQVMDLQDRLKAEEAHRRSLEEKHTHAREALEHFRGAAKEQREQEQRQHEQQVQYLQSEIKVLRDLLSEKQDEITRGNHERTSLTSELSRAERSLHDARGELRLLKDAKVELTSAQQQLERLGRSVVELKAQAQAQNVENEELETQRVADQARIQQLLLDLATAKATAETQNQLLEMFQTWVAQSRETTDAATLTEGAQNPHGKG